MTRVDEASNAEAPKMTDAAIVAGIRNGDESSLAVLYDRYSRLVYAVALRVIGDTGLAEDILQEIFLQLWRNLYLALGIHNPRSYRQVRRTSAQPDVEGQMFSLTDAIAMVKNRSLGFLFALSFLIIGVVCGIYGTNWYGWLAHGYQISLLRFRGDVITTPDYTFAAGAPIAFYTNGQMNFRFQNSGTGYKESTSELSFDKDCIA